MTFQKKAFLPLISLLTLAAFLPGLCLSAAKAETVDPVVVRVGDVEYRQSEVQAYWDSIARYSISMGAVIEESEYESYALSVVESYVGMGVIENKLVEFGLDALSPGDEAALQKAAQEFYDEALEIYTQQIMSGYNRTHEEAEPYARNFMELDGYTMNEALDLALRSLKEERILNYVAGDVPKLSDEELENYYRQNLVAPSEEAYAADYEAFENDVLIYGGESYYISEGYRYVRHIFFKASDETRSRAAELEEQLAVAQADRQTAENKLYAAKLLNENVTSAAQTLSDAKALCASLQGLLDAVYSQTLTLYAEQIADIEARLAAGESFDTLMKEYTQDDLMPEEGFMVSANSVMWEASFKQSAMALTEIGQVGSPVAAPSGVHIIEYTGDAPSGPIPFEGELIEAVAEAAHRERQYGVLSAFVSKWRAEYEVETHPALLTVPACLLAE